MATMVAPFWTDQSITLVGDASARSRVLDADAFAAAMAVVLIDR